MTKDSVSVDRNEKAKREARKRSLVKEGWKTARSKALERAEERGNKAWRGRSNKHESLSSCYASRGRLSPGHPLKPRLESSRWTTWKTSHVVSHLGCLSLRKRVEPTMRANCPPVTSRTRSVTRVESRMIRCRTDDLSSARRLSLDRAENFTFQAKNNLCRIIPVFFLSFFWFVRI